MLHALVQLLPLFMVIIRKTTIYFFIQQEMLHMQSRGLNSIEMYKWQEALVRNIREQLLRMDLPCLPD